MPGELHNHEPGGQLTPLPIQPPRSEQELLERAGELAGKSLQYLAGVQNTVLPDSQVRAKGQIGSMLEKYLGASAGSLPEPDFREIGVELKTLPLNKQGMPKESTYVCVVPLLPGEQSGWEHSLVRRKLSRVLWVPIEADSGIPLSRRRIGSPILWSPTPEQEEILRSDWQELMDMIVTGELHNISARLGHYLQIRPKAQNARSLRQGISNDGGINATLPRGFYLRTRFTRLILQKHNDNY